MLHESQGRLQQCLPRLCLLCLPRGLLSWLGGLLSWPRRWLRGLLGWPRRWLGGLLGWPRRWLGWPRR
jgi:hypothetical protein